MSHSNFILQFLNLGGGAGATNFASLTLLLKIRDIPAIVVMGIAKLISQIRYKTMKVEELYFCLELTENEHWVVRGMIQDFCDKNNVELLYYRKLKTGHIPCVREIKLRGVLGPFRAWAKQKRLWFNLWTLEEHIKKVTEKWSIQESYIIAKKL